MSIPGPSAPAPSGTATPSSPARELSKADTVTLARAGVTIADYCRELQDTGVSPGLEDEFNAAIDKLIEVYRQNRVAIYSPGGKEPRTMQQVISDSSRQIDDCSASKARQLDRVLDE